MTLTQAKTQSPRSKTSKTPAKTKKARLKAKKARLKAKKARTKTKKARAKTPRGPSYRETLKDAIRAFLPGQWFSRWPLRLGLLWTPQRLVYLFLFLAWGVEQSLNERFEAARDLLLSLFPRWKLGRSYTGAYQAMAHWSPVLQPALARRLRQRIEAMAGASWTVEGWCAFAADGSRFECPRSTINKQELGCAGKERTAPQLFLTTLYHLGTGLPWDFQIGPGTASERRHLEAMLAGLPGNALVVADAGFVGYDVFQRIAAAGHSFLIRVGANVDLLQELGYAVREGPSTVYLWPEKRQHEPPLVLRLIVLPRGKKKMYLLSNVLDENALSAESARVLYELRWGVEVLFRSCKQTMQRRKMLSQTAAPAELELRWALMGLWLLGVMSTTQILARGIAPQAWSVALARKRMRQAMRLAEGQRRAPQSLLEQLGEATQDTYERTGSKKAHDWPHKKRPKPPGEPKITVASAEQVQRAQKLRKKGEAA